MGESIGIILLGGYAHSDGGQARLPRKSRALLAYLAVHGAKGVSRDQIADLLWASSDPGKARHSLRQCLASLRHALGEAAPDPVVASDRDRLALSPGAVDVDVHRFLALAQSNKISDLVAAAGLYQGPFLAGFDAGADLFEIWVRGERERLEGVASLALRRLSAASAEARDLEGAIAAANTLTRRIVGG
jgi:DNA-binding SARP family transcriptional activator